MKSPFFIRVSVALGLVVAGCYNPQIPDGAFLCSNFSADGVTTPLSVCPDGYTCDPACLDPANPSKTCTCISDYTLNGGQLTEVPASTMSNTKAALSPIRARAAASPVNSAALVVVPEPSAAVPIPAVVVEPALPTSAAELPVAVPAAELSR